MFKVCKDTVTGILQHIKQSAYTRLNTYVEGLSFEWLTLEKVIKVAIGSASLLTRRKDNHTHRTNRESAMVAPRLKININQNKLCMHIFNLYQLFFAYEHVQIHTKKHFFIHGTINVCTYVNIWAQETRAFQS